MFGLKRPREEDQAPCQRDDQRDDQRSKQQKPNPLEDASPVTHPSVSQAKSTSLRVSALTPTYSSDDDDDRPCKSAPIHLSTGIAVNSPYPSCPLVESEGDASVRQSSFALNAPWGGNPNVENHVTPSASDAFGQLHTPTAGWSSIVSCQAPGPITQLPTPGLDCGNNDNPLDVGLPSPVSDNDTAMPSVDGSDVNMTGDTDESQETLTSSHPLPQARVDTESCQKKPKIFMGYRADCDKCRRGVPGHYNHIIV